MRSVLLVILLSSGLMACATTPSSLPSLKKHQDHRIVQVSNDFDQQRHSEFAYFVVCDRAGCLAPTKKTPIQHQKTVFPVETPIKGQNIQGKNTTYKKKISKVLNQFTVHFAYASAEITEYSKKILKRFVDTFDHHKRQVRITGYTDSGVSKKASIANDWLALERAKNAKDALISLGYPSSQILLEAKFLCCYVATNKTKAGRLQNRRAEFSIITIKE